MDALASVTVDHANRSAIFLGEIDLASYDALTTALEPLMELRGDLTFDLGGVTFIDSSGVRLFVRMHRSRGDDEAVILRNVKANVARVFELSGVSAFGIRIEQTA